jgi:hypothetical protein
MIRDTRRLIQAVSGEHDTLFELWTKTERVMKAMMQMKKLDLLALQRAYDGY